MKFTLAFREPLWYENTYDYGSLTGGRHDSHQRPQTATSLRPMGLSKPQTAADTGTLMDNHRFLLLKVVKGQHPQHRPPVVGVVIGDTVHNPTDFFGDPSWGLAVIIFHMEKG